MIRVSVGMVENSKNAAGKIYNPFVFGPSGGSKST